MGLPFSLMFGLTCWLLSAASSATALQGVAQPGQAMQSGVVIPAIPTRNDPRQKYALYLPRGYRPAAPSPLLIVLDPRGRAEASLAPLVPAAEAHGWIVMSAHGSRSDALESITLVALQALLVESRERFAVAPQRLYLAGMSGTAKSLWTVLPVLQPHLGGLIGCSGGRPPELPTLRSRPPDFFGCAGMRDYNYQQMRELDRRLADFGGNHRLHLFEGGHGWPPPAQLARAIDWMELMAMRDGRTPRRDQWIQAQWQLAQAEARSEPDPYERWRLLDQLRRDFNSLQGNEEIAKAVSALLQSDEVRKTLALETALARDERRFIQVLDGWIVRMNSGKFAETNRQGPPPLGQTLFELKVSTLRKKMLTASPRVSASAQRRLELAHSAANAYVPVMPGVRGDPSRLAACKALAAAIFPERHVY